MRDGIRWTPADAATLADTAQNAAAVVLDSYSPNDDVGRIVPEQVPIVALHDFGEPPGRAALVISVGAPERPGNRFLTGFRFASLRPAYWGLPERRAAPSVQTVLVTAGGGGAAGEAPRFAAAVREALPAARIRVVGSSGADVASPDIEILGSPPVLLRPLLEADLVVSAGGQTMLETLAAGVPCVAVPLVENQRPQTERVAAEQAVLSATPETLADAVGTAAGDADLRAALVRRGQELVDGYGALRIAYYVERLLDPTDDA